MIDTQVWSRRPPLISILRLLASSELPSETDSMRIELEDGIENLFPPAPNFSGSELLEALFLEDVKPIVVFDAPDPELVALRLLTALWPDIRRRFALSTFALSPRKIGGRDLDLVFAPSNTKAKFSGWDGRRVDGRSAQGDRHRWTGEIVRRVFEEPVPKLLSDREISLLGDREADSSAALRIALLWEELLDKLDRVPTAALGLLDIANSGMVNNTAALQSLEPRLAEATRRAGGSLSHNDAWDFLSAIARKVQGHKIPIAKMAVEQLAEHLAECAPDGAVNLLIQPDPNGAIDTLIHSIAIGLGNGAVPSIEQILVEAPTEIIARLVAQGGTLTRRIAEDERLIEKMGIVLSEVNEALVEKAAMTLLPFLIEDRHLPAAIPIISRLDPQGIAAELHWLGDVNGFQAKQLNVVLINRAREVGGLPTVRDVLISSTASPQRDELLALTVDPVRADVLWLLDEKRLSETASESLLVGVLGRADNRQFAALISDIAIGQRVVACIPDDALDVLARTMVQESLPMNSYMHVVQSLICRVDDEQQIKVAEHALDRCLRNRFDGDETAILLDLLAILGSRLDGGWAARTGLARDIDNEVANRNLIVFDDAPSSARMRIVRGVDEIAGALQGRQFNDLSEAAYHACARLMFDAEKTSPKAVFNAAGLLMPSLLRAVRQPVSLMIAVLFPVVYRELARSDNVPDLLKFVPFFEWDRCKTARSELVNAFLSSSWRAGDLALTAYRCGDVDKILRRVAWSYGGGLYLAQIENDLGLLDDNGQRFLKRVIAEIRADKSYKVDW